MHFDLTAEQRLVRDPAESIGVAGAGTMGAGIAQLAAQAGAETRLFDPDAAARERALERILEGVSKAAAKGRADAAAAERVRLVDTLDGFAGCELVIEAAPERLELKRELFAGAAAAAGDFCVLATNTSSLSVTAIAAGVPRPERVVGMHFFNPAPLMRLLEVVAGDQSSPEALAFARATGEAMGKHVIDAADGPGFLVNRCNRPFGLEAMRIVQEGLATPEQVDRICRMGGGFPMGPFELMDLVGLDVGFAVSQSFYEQSFGEPRWRPSQLQARMVAAGRLGRKTGRGWYEYPREQVDPVPPQRGGGDGGLVVVAGESALAAELLEAAAEAGWRAATSDQSEGEVPALIVDCGAGGDDTPPQGGPQVVLCGSAPLAAIGPGGTAAGFFCLPPLGGLVELTRGAGTSATAALAAETFFGSLGMHAEWVGDAPGLVLGRIVAQLGNEACFALGERVGSAEDVDAGMMLGLNHPRGPLEWADLAGPAEILAIVTGLHGEYGEERYRPAPALVRAVRDQTPLRA